MSVEIVRNLAKDLEARVDSAVEAGEGLALLIEMTRTLAQSTADLVFLKLQTESSWTPNEARGLAERALDGHAQAIAESVHANGGTLELALQLNDNAFEAFRNRLAKLGASQGDRGCA